MTDISQELNVINVGLEGFYSELKEQNVPTVQVDWRPPAGGDVALIDKLARLQTLEVEEANAQTISRIKDSRPLWINTSAILGLRKLDIPDPRWREAMEAIADSRWWAARSC
ncbi:MAG TPA: DUF3164 family protein [Solidesulfovibrio magneticus]|nr:DUF3164 family protein [Solidesulfovibrio magneticus]